MNVRLDCLIILLARLDLEHIQFNERASGLFSLSLSLSHNRRRYLTIVGVSPADASASVACCCHIADAIACKKALVDQVSQQAHASCSVAIYIKNNVSDV